MITRRLFAASIAALVCAPALAAPRERTPYTILTQIYGQRQSESAFGLDVEEREAFFSKAVLALWAEADAATKPGESGPIDWDVSTNSQGMEVGSYTVKVARSDATHVDLIVTLVAKTTWTRKSPDENVIRYHFVREDGRWAIDDIRPASDAADKGLKNLLARAAKE